MSPWLRQKNNHKTTNSRYRWRPTDLSAIASGANHVLLLKKKIQPNFVDYGILLSHPSHSQRRASHSPVQAPDSHFTPTEQRGVLF